jgi:hypothetical protein
MASEKSITRAASATVATGKEEQSRIWLAAITVALALVGPACSQSDTASDETSAAGSGGMTSSVQTGVTGGLTGSGGTRTTSTGGTKASTGGSGTGGATGVADSGAVSSDELDARIRVFCSNKQANGFVQGCTAVFASTYLADCAAALSAAAQTCGPEVDAYLSCGTLLTATEYECDANNDVVFAEGVCAAETQSLQTCLG